MPDIPRIIGNYSSGTKGALLFITAGVHGNEPAGVYALQKVFEVLEKEQPLINGRVVGVSGNKKALKKNVRYIDEDLNRTWTEENISSEKVDSHEKKEMFEIIKILRNYPEEDYNRRYFLDCHTTSSESEPYISVQDTGMNDEWAHYFPTYIIRGFSDIVKGCIDHYESRIGLTGFVFEAGQHESQSSINNHEGMIWLALQEACGLKLTDLKNIPHSTKALETKKEKRKTFEIKYRHGIEDGDSFKMEPGFLNFQTIKKGELLAYQNDQPIYSEWDAYIFMPLYQKQGNDGFFIVDEVPVKQIHS